MKIGTDGVLLGAWCDVPADGCFRVLDVGCATGLIALMIAQRCTCARITGIEICQIAAAEGSENAKSSPFSDRVEIICQDFLKFTPSCRYDVIVSNPPFFTETLKSPDSLRATARHEVNLSVKDLFLHAGSMLYENGSIYLVAPSSRDGDVVFSGALSGFFPDRHCKVITVEGKCPVRSLWKFSRHASVCEETVITIKNNQHEFTEEYKQLLKDFYLEF